GGAEAVYAHVVEDGEAELVEGELEHSTDGVSWFTVRIPLLAVVTPYRFAIVRGRHYTWLNQAGAHEHEVTDDGDFRLITVPYPRSWVPGTAVYQSFTDRFGRDDDSLEPPAEHPDWAIPRHWDDEPLGSGPEAATEYYGGTLDGVRRHLDHLAELGAEVVYLTPFFPARSTHRYDAADFDAVDPLLGGDAALKALTREAHARGMRVM